MSESKRISGNDVDVLIVGSGPVGSTFARVIADSAPHARVLMVEAGPVLNARIGEHVQNLSAAERSAAQQSAQGPDSGRPHVEAPFYEAGRAVEPDSDPALLLRPALFLAGPRSRLPGEFGLPAAGMSSGVGGMGVHWTASVPRPSGSERIDFIPEDELEAAYAEADRLLHVSRDLDGGDPLLAKLVSLLGDAFDGTAPDAPPVQLTPFAVTNDADGTRISGTNVILGDLLDDARGDGAFELRPDTLARRIVLHGRKAVGVELMDRSSGEIYEVHATRVVVAADALRTPQLLFASQIRPRALGRYLNDHLKVIGAIRLHDALSGKVEPLADGVRPVGAVLIPYVEGIRPMQGQVHPGSRSPMILAAGVAPTGRYDTGVDGARVPNAGLAWYGAKELQFSDAIEFSDTETDAFGMPAMTIHYTLTSRDAETVERLREEAVRAGRLVGEFVLGEPAFMPGGSSLHYQGSTRMGPADDGESVCDTYGRVWGIENLVIGGNNVIPTSTACNPTITSVALAVRAAQRIAAELST
ncbi:GMC oxidoreductase [Catenulispora rubra]|uniref:GMC oxidoreductase n=1 Tax=Catenulispora rubra TaxID=280293 RepID=UPI0018927F63|nr:GMC oxidoreductase [Catenulispora rubra]